MAIYDRKDGKMLRHVDPMHFICPIIYPKRCDNEAFISETIDLTSIDKYLKKKNKNNPVYKYNLFQIINAAILKCIVLRPKMNYFIQDSNLYERNYISTSFVVKKEFSDKGEEGLAFIKAEKSDTIDTIHEKIYTQVTSQKSGGSDSSSDSMDMFNKMPRFIAKLLVKIIVILDRYGRVPQFLIDSDPYYSSAILTNLGSIKLHAGYHHLTNWGTTSLFVIVGEIKKRALLNSKGEAELKDSVDLGLTIDERIADGYYFSKTVKLLRHLLENPELLELPLDTPVDIDMN